MFGRRNKKGHGTDCASDSKTTKSLRRRSSTKEDDDRDGDKGISAANRGFDRRVSKIPGLMKFVSQSESLISEYGSSSVCNSESEAGDRNGKLERITFSNIEIREYARIIGDNPSCSSGPPIAISWEYGPTITLSIDDYEEKRPPRRSNIEMILPRDVRQKMLRKEWDVTQNQIAAAVRTNIRIKGQRRTTINNLDKSAKAEEAVENFRKALLFRNRKVEKQVRVLEQQMEEAEKARKEALLLCEPSLSKTCDESHPESPPVF